jgi:hypothetical protein
MIQATVQGKAWKMRPRTDVMHPLPWLGTGCDLTVSPPLASDGDPSPVPADAGSGFCLVNI